MKISVVIATIFVSVGVGRLQAQCDECQTPLNRYETFEVKSKSEFIDYLKQSETRSNSKEIGGSLAGSAKFILPELVPTPMEIGWAFSMNHRRAEEIAQSLEKSTTNKFDWSQKFRILPAGAMTAWSACMERVCPNMVAIRTKAEMSSVVNSIDFQYWIPKFGLDASNLQLTVYPTTGKPYSVKLPSTKLRGDGVPVHVTIPIADKKMNYQIHLSSRPFPTKITTVWGYGSSSRVSLDEGAFVTEEGVFLIHTMRLSPGQKVIVKPNLVFRSNADPNHTEWASTLWLRVNDEDAFNPVGWTSSKKNYSVRSTFTSQETVTADSEGKLVLQFALSSGYTDPAGAFDLVRTGAIVEKGSFIEFEIQ